MGTVELGAEVTTPTTRPALVIEVPAAVRVKPTTFGTATSKMAMVALTVWLSTVAVPVPAPAVVPAVKTEVAMPLADVALIGLSVPSVPPKAIGVPLGTLNPVPPEELWARSAARLDVLPTRIWFGKAVMAKTSQGLKLGRVTVPILTVATVSHGEALGPALQPHQLLVAFTVEVPAASTAIPFGPPATTVLFAMRLF